VSFAVACWPGAAGAKALAPLHPAGAAGWGGPMAVQPRPAGHASCLLSAATPSAPPPPPQAWVSTSAHGLPTSWRTPAWTASCGWGPGMGRARGALRASCCWARGNCWDGGGSLRQQQSLHTRSLTPHALPQPRPSQVIEHDEAPAQITWWRKRMAWLTSWTGGVAQGACAPGGGAGWGAHARSQQCHAAAAGAPALTPPATPSPPLGPGTGTPEDVMEMDRELTASDANDRALKRLRSHATMSGDGATAAAAAAAVAAADAEAAAAAAAASPARPAGAAAGAPPSPVPTECVAVLIGEGAEDSAAGASRHAGPPSEEEVSEHMVAPKWWSTVSGRQGQPGQGAGSGQAASGTHAQAPVLFALQSACSSPPVFLPPPAPPGGRGDGPRRQGAPHDGGGAGGDEGQPHRAGQGGQAAPGAGTMGGRRRAAGGARLPGWPRPKTEAERRAPPPPPPPAARSRACAIARPSTPGTTPGGPSRCTPSSTPCWSRASTRWAGAARGVDPAAAMVSPQGRTHAFGRCCRAACARC
jgi:hypothetical protein